MKACFCGELNSQRIDYVFSGGRREKIAEKVDLLDEVINTSNLEAYQDQLKDVEIVLGTWEMPVFSIEEIRTFFPALKLVLYAAGSVQRFARPYLELGILVVNTSSVMAIPVAQFSLSLIIQLSKGFFLAEEYYKKEGFQVGRDITTHHFPGLYDGTPIGILGAGNIGRALIGYLKPFDVSILVFDPFLSDEDAITLGVKKASLEEIFTTCQVISNHIANNPQTVGMLNYSLFSRMKKNAAFINTGRGAQVVEDDLVRAIQDEPLRFAVLDVTTDEPYPLDGPLRTCKNIFMVPHITGYAASEVHCQSDYVIEQLDNYLNHRELGNVVTLAMLKTMA